MKPQLFIAALAVAVTSAALAQEEKPAENPDYSKPTMMRIFSADDTPPPRARRIKHTPGAFEFRALGMDWRVAYLPILMPLAGSRMTTSREWPDAFALSGTQYASPKKTWRERRTYSAEIRRINRLDRKRARVVLKK